MDDEKDDDGKAEEQVAVPRRFTPTRDEMLQALMTVHAGLAYGIMPPVVSRAEPQEPVTAVGPGDPATGSEEERPKAYEQFVDAVRALVGDEAWEQMEVKVQRAWVQVASRRNASDRLYIAKARLRVSRVECTLPPGSIPEATEPDRPNGSIRSSLPANEEVVARAITLMARRASGSG